MTRTPDQVPPQPSAAAARADREHPADAAHAAGHERLAGREYPAGGPPRAEQLRADARKNRDRLIAAATTAFADKGADAPLEDIARRAGVGIGTLYRHFPTRLDLQAAVFRSQVSTVCGQGEALLETEPPEKALMGWLRALAAYLVTKRGLSKALIDAIGVESELISSCWMTMRETTERLLASGQQAGVVRPDVDATDVMRLVHGLAVSSEKAPERTDHLLGVMLDGLRAKPDSTPE